MDSRAFMGIAVAAMGMHEVLVRTLVSKGIVEADELRDILDKIILQLESRHGAAVGIEKDVINAQIIAFRNLLEQL